MANILTAIKFIVDFTDLGIKNITDGNNRMNNMGEGLEAYIKNAFANTLVSMSETKRLEEINRAFSYTGNKNNPPDMMLRGGDAIEVKKIESLKSNLQLNSSHPKSKLLVSNTKINKTCKSCEDWKEKDLIYSIGHVKAKQLHSLWMVYGDCYAADDETYEKVESNIKDSISLVDSLEINDTTNELSGIKNVDPLNITYLRVRGMWIIENPSKVFDYIYNHDLKVKFQMITLMKKTKFESFSSDDRNQLKSLENLTISDVKIKNPNNPADLIEATLIVYKVV